MPESAPANQDELTAKFIMAIVREGTKPEFTLSNGIVLRTVAVPREVVRRLFASLPEPQPPMFQRDPESAPEPNPLDPGYLAALDEWNNERILLLRKALWGFGTEVVSVPEGMQTAEDDGWIADLEAMGVAVPREPRVARHLAWLELYAAQGRQDEGRVFAETASTYGLLEKEVTEAMANFWRGALHGADISVPVASEGGADGDSDSTGSPGRRPRVRGTRSRKKPAHDLAAVGEPAAG